MQFHWEPSASAYCIFVVYSATEIAIKSIVVSVIAVCQMANLKPDEAINALKV